MTTVNKSIIKKLILEVLDEARSFKEAEADKDIESMNISVPSLISDISNLFEERLLSIKNNPEALYKFGIMLDETRVHIENYMKENPVQDEEDFFDDDQKF